MNKFFLLAIAGGSLLAAGCRKEQPPEPYSVLEELSHLATLKCEFNVISSMVHSDLVRGEDRVLSLATGSSVLAINVLKADCRREGDTFVITLPEVEVVSPKLDTEWERFGEHRSGLTSETDYNRWRDEAEKQAQNTIEERSRDPELVKMAKDQARHLILGFYAQWPEMKVIVR